MERGSRWLRWNREKLLQVPQVVLEYLSPHLLLSLDVFCPIAPSWKLLNSVPGIG